MSTVVVYEGLHESQFTETRTLTLKVSSSHPSEIPPFTQDDRNTNNIIHASHFPRTCWDFGNINSQQFEKLETPSSYVPPTSNKSLPNVCLELCTENLGSESGSDVSDHSDILSLLSAAPHFYQPKQSKTGEFKKTTAASRSFQFPPPLTTMRGVNPIRVRPKREGGRLVIQAVEEPAPCNYFRSERSHGRLRLCFWDDNPSGNGSDDDDHHHEEDERICDKEEDQGLNLNVREEDMLGNNLNDGVEIGNQKLQRRSNSSSRYCKESGSCNNKEPFWVASYLRETIPI